MQNPNFILVENPHTGKHVNIMPLFDYLQNEYSGSPITHLQATEPIQDALDYLAVSLPTEGIDTYELVHRNCVNDRLITLRNTFSDMFKVA
jgi:hypothetical protein